MRQVVQNKLSQLRQLVLHWMFEYFQDLDFNTVLWMQDEDLGVGKEVFDINLRRQLEREQEIELQKERQKVKYQVQISLGRSVKNKFFVSSVGIYELDICRKCLHL